MFLKLSPSCPHVEDKKYFNLKFYQPATNDYINDESKPNFAQTAIVFIHIKDIYSLISSY